MKTIALLAIILMQATSEVIDMSNKMAEIEMVEALEQIEGKIENEQLLLDFLNDEKMLREEKDYLRTFSQTKNVSSKTRQTTEFQNETGSSSKETSQVSSSSLEFGSLFFKVHVHLNLLLIFPTLKHPDKRKSKKKK